MYHNPWVGNNYGGILILGESHHGDGDYVDYTVDTVSEYVNGRRQPSFRFFTILGQILTGRLAWELDAVAVWNSVAFANYVPALMTGARTCPTKEQWAEAAEIFPKLLSALEPHPSHILTLGERLWSAMAHLQHGRETHNTALGTVVRVFRTEEGRFSRAIKLQHPSSAISPSKWHPIVKEFLGASDGEVAA